MANVPRDFWSYHKAYLKYDSIGPIVMGTIFGCFIGVQSVFLDRLDTLGFASVVTVGLAIAMTGVYTLLREIRRWLSFTSVKRLSLDRADSPKFSWFETLTPVAACVVMIYLGSGRCGAVNLKVGYVFWQGRQHMAAGEFEAAAECFDRFVEMDPRYPDAYRWRAKANQLLGNTDAERIDRLLLLQLSPRDWESYPRTLELVHGWDNEAFNKLVQAARLLHPQEITRWLQENPELMTAEVVERFEPVSATVNNMEHSAIEETT